jgi:formyl-CoA transferase
VALVEVAMQEAAYATLTSQLHAYFETGRVPPRTGNASHSRVPLNVYPTSDGYVAMNIAVEEHWHNLLRAMRPLPWFAPDSPLEGTGFELAVPRKTP